MRTLPDAEVIECPYHSHWVSIGFWNPLYRTCPACGYCVRCSMLKRSKTGPHSHGKYRFTDAELEKVTA